MKFKAGDRIRNGTMTATIVEAIPNKIFDRYVIQLNESLINELYPSNTIDEEYVLDKEYYRNEKLKDLLQ